MSSPIRVFSAALAALAALISIPASAQEEEGDAAVEGAGRRSDFMDTRLTLTFGDDDLIHPTGEQLPISPLPGFGDRPAYELFFDNLNTRFSGRENVSHLVVYRELPAYFDDVTTEAALVVRFGFDQPFVLEDTGSYLRVRYNPWLEAPDDGLRITLFPLDSDRVRLGYLYDLSFGGRDIYPVRGLDGLALMRVPGAMVELAREAGTYWVAVKTFPSFVGRTIGIDGEGSTAAGSAQLLRETQVSVLGGIALDLFGDALRFDLGAGYFQRGEAFGITEYPDGTPLYLYGASARVAYRRHLELDDSLDLQLYDGDPNRALRFFQLPTYVPGQLGYLVSVEAEATLEHRLDSDRAGETRFEPGLAGAARFRLQVDFLRIELNALYRDVAFLLRDATVAGPILSIPRAAEVAPNLMFAAAADLHLPDARLTLEAAAGVELPGRLASPSDVEGSGGGDIAFAGREMVVRGDGRTTLLPVGQEPAPMVSARIGARWDLSEMLYTRLWVQYMYDPNRSKLAIAEPDGSLRGIEPLAHVIGVGAAAAARF